MSAAGHNLQAAVKMMAQLSVPRATTWMVRRRLRAQAESENVDAPDVMVDSL